MVTLILIIQILDIVEVCSNSTLGMTFERTHTYESSGRRNQLCLPGQSIPLETPKTWSKVKLVNMFNKKRKHGQINFWNKLASCNRLVAKLRPVGLVGYKGTAQNQKSNDIHNLMMDYLNFS